MKFKKTLLVSSLLMLAAACTDKNNGVKVEMTNCEGTLCSFDASKSKVKQESHVLEYDWHFHDDTDVAVTKEPKVEHDFNIFLGATANGEDPDLDLREVTLDQVLTNHQIVSKTFKFRTHEHDPKALFLAKKSEELGLPEGAQLFDLDASDSEAGQGSIKEYIWEVDGKKTITETPELKQEFTDKSSGDVKLTVVNTLGVEQSTTENVFTGIFSTRPKAIINVIPHEDGMTYTLDGSASEAGKQGGVKKPVKEWMWTIDNNGFWPESGEKIDVKFETPGIHTVRLFVISSLATENLTDSTEVTIDVQEAVQPAFTSELSATEVKGSDGLHYNFTVDTNNYDKSKYDLVYKLNGKVITETKNVVVREGANTVVAQLVAKDGTVAAEKSTSFTATAVVTPAFTSELSATEVKDSDGLHYDFAVDTNDYDKSKYDLVYKLNGNVITETKNVVVSEGANTVLAQLVAKDGTVAAEKSTPFTATAVITPAFTSELSATEVKDSDGLHYDFAVDTNDYDKSKYDLVYKLNGKVITETKNVVVSEGANTVLAQLVAKDGTVAAEKSTPFTATAVITPAFTSELSATEVKDSDGLHYDFAVDTNDYDKSKYDLVYKLNGNVITETKNVVVREGANTVVAQLVAKDGTVAAEKSTSFTATAVVTPAFTSELSATEVKDSDGLHYDFAVDTNDYDKSKYGLVYKLNGKVITETKNVVVREGANTVVAQLVAKDGTVAAEKSTSFTATAVVTPAFTSELSATEVKDSDGLHYDFAVDTNEYDKSKYDLVYKLNGKASNSKNVLVNEGANTLVAQLVAKDDPSKVEAETKTISFNANATEITYSKKPSIIEKSEDEYTVNFNYKAPTERTVKTDMFVDGHLVKSEEYSSASMGMSWPVKVDDAYIDHGVQVIYTDKMLNREYKSDVVTIKAKELKAVISNAILGADGLTYTFETDGSSKGDGYKYTWTYGVDANSIGEGTTGKWTYPAKYSDAGYKATLTITTPSGKKVSSPYREVHIKALSKPSSKIFVTPDASNGLKFHFSREIDWNGRNPNDFDVHWLLDGNINRDFAALGNSFDYEFPKSKEGAHYVKLTLVEKATKLEFKSEPVNINVKDTSIPKESTPAYAIGQNIETFIKGNDVIGTELHIKLPSPNGSKFVSASETYDGRPGTINEFTNTEIKFDGHHLRTGNHYFNLTLEKDGVYQDVSYSCKQDYRTIIFVFDPYIDSCTPLTWGQPYKK